jgi:hypothetical protein
VSAFLVTLRTATLQILALWQQLFQVFIKPVSDLLQPANAVFRLAAAAEFVIFTPEHAEAGLDAKVLQGGKHLQAFRQPAAVVFF